MEATNANDENARLGPGAEGTPRYFHFNCRRRGLGPPDRGHEQDRWHGSNRKHWGLDRTLERDYAPIAFRFMRQPSRPNAPRVGCP